MSPEEFAKKFVTLVVGSRELPRKPRALNVILMSAILGLDPDRTYTEREVDAELQKWILSFGRGFGVDFVTLRRVLVDERFLMRDSAGRAYHVEEAIPGFGSVTQIRALDLEALLRQAKEDRERRKQQHLGGM